LFRVYVYESKITAITENHGTRPGKATMIDIIDDTDNIDPSLLRV